MYILKSEKIDRGICLIDTYKAPGDLYDSWDIVQANSDGTFPRKPNAGYGPDAVDRNVEDWDFEAVHVIEEYTRFDENGWTKSETVIRANGKLVAIRRY